MAKPLCGAYLMDVLGSVHAHLWLPPPAAPRGNWTALQAICEGTVELPSLDSYPGNATEDVVSGTVLPTGSSQGERANKQI